MGKTIVCIPARYASTRFEGKPIAELYDKPLIQHVYDRCRLVANADEVIILTDDKRIADVVGDFKGKFLMTSPHHQSGTDRIGEAISQLDDIDIVINVQGDEPLIEPKLVEQLINLLKNENVEIVTACSKILKSEDLFDYNVVKVVRNVKDNALYFSRQAIPAQRDLPYQAWFNHHDYFRHIGIYGFKASVLVQLVNSPVSDLEDSEKLEQLRWLQLGYNIKCITTDYEAIGVDTPQDLEKINELILKKSFSDLI